MPSQKEQNFEQAFFQLQFGRLQESLGNLLPYLAGFQVQNKKDDGTKALGVFLFKSPNGSDLFVPQFFVNGSVAELDSLYNREMDQFFPLSEEFQQKFLEQPQEMFGSEQEQDLNTIRNSSQQGSDFRDLIRPPQTGRISTASDNSKYPDQDELLSTIKRQEHDLMDYVQALNKEAQTTFYQELQNNPAFYEQVGRFYSNEKIQEAVSSHFSNPEQAKARPQVGVITDPKDESLKSLKQKKKKEFLSNGYVFYDERPDNLKTTFENQVPEYKTKFTNPIESGFYEYLQKDGSLNQGLVLLNPKPIGHISNKYFNCIVVDIKTAKAFMIPSTELFVYGQTKVDDLAPFLDKLDSLDTVSAQRVNYSDDEQYLLINENLKSTGLFTVRSNTVDSQGIRRVVIKQYPPYSFRLGRCDTQRDVQPGLIENTQRGSECDTPGSRDDNDMYTLVSQKNRSDNLDDKRSTVIYVPSNFKVLKVTRVLNEGNQPVLVSNSEKFSKGRKKNNEQDKLVRESNSILPGGLSAATKDMEINGYYPVSVTSNGGSYFQTLQRFKKHFQEQRLQKAQMVFSWGLDPEVQEDILKKQESKEISGYIKVSNLGDSWMLPPDETATQGLSGEPLYNGITQNWTNVDPHQYFGYPDARNQGNKGEVPGQPPQGEVPGYGQGQGGGQDGIDPRFVQSQIQQSQGGQKEIFDQQVLEALSKKISPYSKISEYQPDFLRSLDRLGRLLFMFNWDTDKFEEMFGRDDLPEFKELLKSVFKNLGDLFLFLQKKSPEININLSEGGANLPVNA